MPSAEHVIQNSIDMVEIEPELNTIERIEEGITAIRLLRQQKIHQLQTTNNQLNTDITQLNQEIKQLKTVSDHNKHIINQLSNISQLNNDDLNDQNIFHLLNKKMLQLDNYQLNIANSLIDLESSISSLSVAKNKLTTTSDKLTNDLTKDSLPDNSNGVILKLNILTSLGVKIDTIDEKDHVFIHNDSKGLNMLTVDDNLSDYFITNHIWECLE